MTPENIIPYYEYANPVDSFINMTCLRLLDRGHLTWYNMVGIRNPTDIQADSSLLGSIPIQEQSPTNYTFDESNYPSSEGVPDSSIWQQSSREYGLALMPGPSRVEEYPFGIPSCAKHDEREKLGIPYPKASTFDGTCRQYPNLRICRTSPTIQHPARLLHTEGHVRGARGTHIAKVPELIAVASTRRRNSGVYASLDYTNPRGHVGIRVRRSPEVRWNETMQCEYISPITGWRCMVQLNRGPDLERHLRTVHLRQEAQAVTDELISRSQAKLLPASWKVGDRLDFGCPHCLARFTRRDARNRHVKIKHGSDSPISM